MSAKLLEWRAKEGEKAKFTEEIEALAKAREVCWPRRGEEKRRVLM